MSQNGHGDQASQKNPGVLTTVSNGVARFGGGAVGFISEYKEHRKQRQLQTPESAIPRVRSTSDIKTAANITSLPIHDDEDAWMFDETADASNEKSGAVKEDWRSVDTLVNDDNNFPDPYRVRKPLPCPVIIPQRRPGDHARGFVRAYAPMLADCGISQDTFLYFLKDFFESSKASPIFVVLQIGGGLMGAIPELHAQALSQIIGPISGIGMVTQGRYRTNSFLYRANKLLFEPAGLIATIVKYKPQSELDDDEKGDVGAVQLQEVNVSNEKVGAATKFNISKFMKSVLDNETVSSINEKFKLGTSTTEGAIAIPQAAPLIFPETYLPHDGPETLKDKWKDFTKTLADYNDRRAQIRYGEKDPDSGLVLPPEQTKLLSAYADPNHPISKNGVKGLFTGGKRVRSTSQVDVSESQRPDQANMSRQESWESGQSENALHETHSKESQGSGKAGGGVKNKLAKLMKKDILYLTIVNMPTKEEMEKAQEILAEMAI